MPRVDVRHNRLTLPDELSEAVHLAEEDYVEAAVVEEGILLRLSPEARRRTALARIRQAQDGVRYVGPEPRPSSEEERQIADLLAEDKAERRGGRRP